MTVCLTLRLHPIQAALFPTHYFVALFPPGKNAPCMIYFSFVESDKPLIIGIGNSLMRDDGVGPYVISLLEQKSDIDADLLVLATPGFALLTHFEGRSLVVIVDAASFEGAPGTVTRITRDMIGKKPSSGFSLHDIDPFAVYDQAKTLGLAPNELVVYAIRFETIAPREGLSPSVEAGARRAADLIAEELCSNA
jgi:hydrogenase maturation protease